MSLSPFPETLALNCKGIGCDRGGTPIVRGVSFTLDAGNAIQIFGANGAGKSTLLGALAGRSHPAEGTIEWQDRNGDKHNRTPREHFAILDHEGALKPSLTISENLSFWRRLYAKTKSEEDAVLEQTGIASRARQRVSTLSAGQRRRLSLARLILSARPVWFLDEPTASVDAKGVDDITALLKGHLERGGLAIIATHHPLTLQGAKIRLG